MRRRSQFLMSWSYYFAVSGVSHSVTLASDLSLSCFLCPRWVRSQWPNHGVQRRGKGWTKNNTKERRRKWKRSTWRWVQGLASLCPPVCLLAYSYTFSLCVSGSGGDKRANFCGTVLFLSSLVSVHVTWSALYVFYIHTLINQCDKCLPTSLSYRSYSYCMWLYIDLRHTLASPTLIWNLHIGFKTGNPGIVCLAWAAEWRDSFCSVMNPMRPPYLFDHFNADKRIRNYICRYLLRCS